jgi:hypothetical protein
MAKMGGQARAAVHQLINTLAGCNPFEWPLKFHDVKKPGALVGCRVRGQERSALDQRLGRIIV